MHFYDISKEGHWCLQAVCNTERDIWVTVALQAKLTVESLKNTTQDLKEKDHPNWGNHQKTRIVIRGLSYKSDKWDELDFYWVASD